ncbi:hypothetical protein XELAEV_18002003mg [Xenopus laevis]|nr:hypothetical protein XELAEV_18002003mg [Xenopus laevis]
MQSVAEQHVCCRIKFTSGVQLTQLQSPKAAGKGYWDYTNVSIAHELCHFHYHPRLAVLCPNGKLHSNLYHLPGCLPHCSLDFSL